MGWTSIKSNLSNKDFYKEFLNSPFVNGQLVVTDVSFYGNEIYELISNKETGEKFIGLYLLKRNDGDVFYKRLDETAYPYYFNAPLKFLKSSNCKIGSAELWRKHCLEMRLKKSNRKDLLSMIKDLKSGSVVEMSSGSKVEFLYNYNRARFAGRLVSDSGEINSVFAWSYKQVERILKTA